jgi:hypothetical protein
VLGRRETTSTNKCNRRWATKDKSHQMFLLVINDYTEHGTTKIMAQEVVLSCFTATKTINGNFGTKS